MFQDKKTSSDVQERTKAGVRPQDAVLWGKTVENYLSKQVGEDGNDFSISTSGKNIAEYTSVISMMSNLNLKPSIKLPGSNICRSIMSEKDVRDEKFQANLTLYIE